MIRETVRPPRSGRQPSRGPYQAQGARDWTRQGVLGAVAGVLATLLAACSSLTCQPVPVTVAQKEERSRLEMVPTGGFTSETGQLKEARAPEVVRSYWVRAADGTWYRVSADQFRTVEIGGTVELCR